MILFIPIYSFINRMCPDKVFFCFWQILSKESWRKHADRCRKVKSHFENTFWNPTTSVDAWYTKNKIVHNNVNAQCQLETKAISSTTLHCDYCDRSAFLSIGELNGLKVAWLSTKAKLTLYNSVFWHIHREWIFCFSLFHRTVRSQWQQIQWNYLLLCGPY